MAIITIGITTTVKPPEETIMRKSTTRRTAIMLALTAATALSACTGVDRITTSAAVNPMDSVVKIVTTGGGHGSGVHIGDGYIVTAAHVVDGGVDHVRFDMPGEIQAKVLWSNADYDVSLLRMDSVVSLPRMDGREYGASSLDCREPRVGESLSAMGSPGREDFISLFGRAASGVREAAPKWKEVVVTDIAATGGISGGGVFAEDGRVVGIMVGGMLAPIARTDKPKSIDDYDLSQSGISYMVPASTICHLLAWS